MRTGVQRFSGHDTCSCSKNLLGVDKWSGTQVRAGADILHNGTEGDKASDIRHGEAVLASLDGSDTSGRDSRVEELHMGGFVSCDELEVLEEGLVESGIEEVLNLEACKGFLVEGVLQEFELVKSHSSALASLIYPFVMLLTVNANCRIVMSPSESELLLFP